jgi:hypothetical protein
MLKSNTYLVPLARPGFYLAMKVAKKQQKKKEKIMNVITIELCAEDRGRLDKIIELLGGLRLPDCSSCSKDLAGYLDHATSVLEARSEEAAAPTVKAPVVAEPEPVKAAPAVTLEQIQKKATQIAAASADKKAKLRALVNQYASKVTDLPADTWPAVWDALCALESEA